MPNILKVQPRPFESDNPECLEKELTQVKHDVEEFYSANRHPAHPVA